jgi:hypothetical protein
MTGRNRRDGLESDDWCKCFGMLPPEYGTGATIAEEFRVDFQRNLLEN